MNTSNPDREPLNIEGKVCRADILISLRDTTWIGDEKTSLDQLSQVIRVMKDDSVFKEQLEQGFIQIPADYKENKGFELREIWNLPEAVGNNAAELSPLEQWKERQLKALDLESPFQLSIYTQWYIQEYIMPMVDLHLVMLSDEIRSHYDHKEFESSKHEHEFYKRECSRFFRQISTIFNDVVSEMFPITNHNMNQVRKKIADQIELQNKANILPARLASILTGSLCPMECHESSLLGMIYHHSKNRVSIVEAEIRSQLRKTAK